MSGFSLGFAPCDHFRAGQFIKSGSKRPQVVKIVEKGDVRSFKVLPLPMSRNQSLFPPPRSSFLCSQEMTFGAFVLTVQS